MLRPLLAPLLLGAALAAQQPNTTAYPQTALGGPYGNSVPFGCSTSGLFVEGRSQILIRAPYLPSPNAMLTGIAVHSQTASAGSGTLVYPLLRITISRSTAAVLSPTFDSNLTTPVIVLNEVNLPIHWVANAWTMIPFSTPYLHDGGSGLVIEIQKIVSPTLDVSSRTIQNSGRADLPRMINATGGAGSNARTATTATVTTNYPLAMQLRWTMANQQPVPTLKLRSDAASNFGNQFAIGRSIDHTVQAAPGVPVVHFVAPVLEATRLPSPLFVGRVWMSNQFPLSQGIVPASGETTLTIAIPNDAALVGAYLVFQSILVDAPAPPWRVTNAADCSIRS